MPIEGRRRPSVQASIVRRHVDRSRAKTARAARCPARGDKSFTCEAPIWSAACVLASRLACSHGPWRSSRLWRLCRPQEAACMMLPGPLFSPLEHRSGPPAKKPRTFTELAWTRPSTWLPAHALPEARQPVVGDRRPLCGVVDELVGARADAGILVQRSEAHAQQLLVLGMLREDVAATFRAIALIPAAVARPVG